MSTTQENHKVLAELRALGYHETIYINNFTEVMRVPGGLIYTTITPTTSTGRTSSGVFVPFQDKV